MSQMMYLSSRSIGQANITRDYLNTIVQRGEQGEHRMPLGPIIISPDGILPSLYRQVLSLSNPKFTFTKNCEKSFRLPLLPFQYVLPCAFRTSFQS